MNLQTTIDIYSGGPGSGCNPSVGKCGRKSDLSGDLISLSHIPEGTPLLHIVTKDGTVIPVTKGEHDEAMARVGYGDKNNERTKDTYKNFLLDGGMRVTTQWLKEKGSKQLTTVLEISNDGSDVLYRAIGVLINSKADYAEVERTSLYSGNKFYYTGRRIKVLNMLRDKLESVR